MRPVGRPRMLPQPPIGALIPPGGPGHDDYLFLQEFQVLNADDRCLGRPTLTPLPLSPEGRGEMDPRMVDRSRDKLERVGMRGEDGV